MRKKILKFCLLLTVAAFFVFLPFKINAISFWDVGGTLGLGTANLQATTIKIIQWILGLLGLIGVIMILYGGFIWLTSAGNEDKVSKAKKIITAAIIGLAVIILAWAIVQFALSALANVTV